MPVIDRQALRDSGLNCIYDRNRLDPERVRRLLADDASELLTAADPIQCTSQAKTWRTTIDGEAMFAKELHVGRWYHRLTNRVVPEAFRNFWAAGRLLKANLLTPAPVLAAVIRQSGRPRQLLVTEFCDAAEELDVFMAAAPPLVRRAAIAELANLLSDFHVRGFYSRHLRSANILVQPRDGRRNYWFIDLDRMGSSRLRPNRCFVSTASRACADFYGALNPDERNFLFVCCFDYALKKNIFSRPSQQAGFVRQALAQVKARAGDA